MEHEAENSRRNVTSSEEFMKKMFQFGRIKN
jgi:hypothetical protein